MPPIAALAITAACVMVVQPASAQALRKPAGPLDMPKPKPTPPVPAQRKPGQLKTKLPDPRPTPAPTPGPFSHRPDPIDPQHARDAVAAEERAKTVKDCKAKGGAWSVSVRGMRISASGSDVNEIYGDISVQGYQGGGFIPFAKYYNTRQSPGRKRQDIWQSTESVDLGENEGPGLGTVVIPMDRPTQAYPSHVTIFYRLYDEDGPRGGDDDPFYTEASFSKKYVERSTTHNLVAPTCDEAPVFERETRFQTPLLSKGNNRILVTLRLHWFRGIADPW